MELLYGAYANSCAILSLEFYLHNTAICSYKKTRDGSRWPQGPILFFGLDFAG